jgi:hypothetical protein
MEDFGFIQEREEETFVKVFGVLIGWETVVFQLEDVPPEE